MSTSDQYRYDAIEAAARAIDEAAALWDKTGHGDITLMDAAAEYYDLPGVRADDGRAFAIVAYDAIAPVLRLAFAEEAAAGGCCVEFGIFQDCTAEGLGQAFLETRHTREDAIAAVDRLATEHPQYPAYAKKRTVRHGQWEPVDETPGPDGAA